MSVKISTLVWNHFREGGTLKLVFLALADHADHKGGSCYPSIATLASMACCSEVQARRHVHALIEAGLVRVVGYETGGGGSRHYEVAIERLTPLTDERGTPLTHGRGNDTEPLSPTIGVPLSPRVVTPLIHGRDPSHSHESRTSLPVKNHIGQNGFDVVGFDRFWMAYPRKVAKKAALKAWKKLHPAEALQAEVLSALARQKGSTQWTRDRGAFIPHASTWLNGRRWEDDLEPERSVHQGLAI